MSLYTGKGDNGTSKLFNTPSGERLSKAGAVFGALGNVDEVNSFLGLCKIQAEEDGFRLGNSGPFLSEIIHEVQETLFIIQAELAGSEVKLVDDKIREVEHIVEYIDNVLPEIKTFFISGGTKGAALFDTARTIVRRAERAIVNALETGNITPSANTVSYMNRLSSLFYALARYVNFLSGESEEAPKYK